MEILILTSFLAGILTVLTPCSLTLLPIILGGSLESKSKIRPLLIVTSLSFSIFLFSLVIKAGVSSLNFNDSFFRILSGLIIGTLGVFNLYPHLWENISLKLGLTNSSQSFLFKSQKYNRYLGAILTGIALGPVFSSCSPMYGYILFAILPLNLVQGIFCLILFLLGMSFFLLLISLLGQRVIEKTKWAANPDSKFRRGIGLLFLIIGITIILRIDKTFESFLLEQPFVQKLLLNRVEQNIINSL